jgi:hypothetical protein
MKDAGKRYQIRGAQVPNSMPKMVPENWTTKFAQFDQFFVWISEASMGVKRKRIEAGLKAKAARVAVREDCTASQLASKFGVYTEQDHPFHLRLGDCQNFSDILRLDLSCAATGLFEPQRFLVTRKSPCPARWIPGHINGRKEKIKNGCPRPLSTPPIQANTGRKYWNQQAR